MVILYFFVCDDELAADTYKDSLSFALYSSLYPLFKRHRATVYAVKVAFRRLNKSALLLLLRLAGAGRGPRAED